MSTTSCDWLALGREVLAVEIEGLEAVREGLGESFVQAVELLAGCTGRVAVTGLGKSGLVGRKIAATLSSTGTPAYFLHPVEGAHGDLGLVRPGDVVLAISNSGETDELNAILPALQSLEARIIALTGAADSTLGRCAEVVLEARVPREACPHNLAPTASTTAALAVGDALAVCLIRCKAFTSADFRRRHPGGALGQRLAKTVAELMRADTLPVVGPRTPLRQALEVMNSGGLGFLAVCGEGRRLSGVVSDGDLRRLLVRGVPDLDQPVSALMRPDPAHLSPEASAAQALDLMEGRQITVLPVVDADGVLEGMIHLHDLLGKGRLTFAA